MGFFVCSLNISQNGRYDDEWYSHVKLWRELTTYNYTSSKYERLDVTRGIGDTLTKYNMK